jgi:hypothetical protein
MHRGAIPTWQNWMKQMTADWRILCFRPLLLSCKPSGISPRFIASVATAKEIYFWFFSLCGRSPFLLFLSYVTKFEFECVLIIYTSVYLFGMCFLWKTCLVFHWASFGVRVFMCVRGCFMKSFWWKFTFMKYSELLSIFLRASHDTSACAAAHWRTL